MANQFDRRGPPDRIKTKHDESTKDKIRAEMLSKRLEKYAKARGKGIQKHHMEPAQVQAAKVLIDRGKPVLQAIETTQTNPWDSMSEQEMYEQVKALITSSQSLLLRVLDEDPGLRAAVQAHITQKPVAVEQQTQRSNAHAS